MLELNSPPQSSNFLAQSLNFLAQSLNLLARSLDLQARNDYWFDYWWRARRWTPPVQ